AEVTLLDTGRLALDVDLKPDTSDAGRLHEEVAGLAGDAGIGLVSADDCIKRAVAAHLLIDDDVDHDIALGGQPQLLEILHRQHVAGDAALHVAGTAAVDTAILDRSRPGIVAPTLAIA